MLVLGCYAKTTPTANIEVGFVPPGQWSHNSLRCRVCGTSMTAYDDIYLEVTYTIILSRGLTFVLLLVVVVQVHSS